MSNDESTEMTGNNTTITELDEENKGDGDSHGVEPTLEEEAKRLGIDPRKYDFDYLL